MAPKTAAQIEVDKRRRQTRDAKALAHPLRVRILDTLDDGVSSPNQLAQELDEPLGNVSYHIKTLLEYEAVELVKTEPRRGAVEHYYRATGRITAGGVTLTRDKAHMAAKVIREALEGDERPPAERKTLGALIAELAAA